MDQHCEKYQNVQLYRHLETWVSHYVNSTWIHVLPGGFPDIFARPSLNQHSEQGQVLSITQSK